MPILELRTDQDIERVNLAYITSCRWVDSFKGGTLTSLAHCIRSGDNDLARRFNLVGIIVDDDPDQYAWAWARGDLWHRTLVVPIRGKQGVAVEKSLESMTLQVPSQPWKNLRQAGGETLAEFRARKAQAKSDYEQRILRFLMRNQVDLVVADSYLTIFGPDLLTGYAGRIVNIHPAITQVGDPARVPGRTPTRDTYTRAAFGCIIVDDKRRADIPYGRRVYVECEGILREAVEVEKNREAGVTVHVVTEEIDAGPIILCERYFIEDDELTFEGIRARNNRIKKELVPRALLAYITREDVLQSFCEARSRMLAFTEPLRK